MCRALAVLHVSRNVIAAAKRLMTLITAVRDLGVVHNSIVLVQFPSTGEVLLARHAHQWSLRCPFTGTFLLVSGLTVAVFPGQDLVSIATCLNIGCLAFFTFCHHISRLCMRHSGT